MDNLSSKHCEPCEGGLPPLTKEEVTQCLTTLPSWSLNAEGTQISKHFEFKGYYKTISFVNALAWIANQQSHHPTLEVGYNYCIVRYTTHAISGLSMNDFICAAKVEAFLVDN